MGITQFHLKFGQAKVSEVRQHRPNLGGKWHLDKVVVTIKGKKFDL